MKTFGFVLFGILLNAAPVAGQELPDLITYLNSVKTDVQATGGIGINSDGTGMFMPSDQRQTFGVQFAVDREILKQINANCVVNSFMFTGDELCNANIKAEITFDGARASLLVFDVTNLQNPQE